MSGGTAHMRGITLIFLNALGTSGLLNFIAGILIVGFILLADSVLLLILSTYTGGIIALSINAGSSLLGALFAGSSFRKYSISAIGKIHVGIYPEKEFIHLGSLFISLTAATLPGLFSLLISIVLYIPFIRKTAGWLLHRKFSKEFGEVYNYCRMAEE